MWRRFLDKGTASVKVLVKKSTVYSKGGLAVRSAVPRLECLIRGEVLNASLWDLDLYITHHCCDL